MAQLFKYPTIGDRWFEIDEYALEYLKVLYQHLLFEQYHNPAGMLGDLLKRSTVFPHASKRLKAEPSKRREQRPPTVTPTMSGELADPLRESVHKPAHSPVKGDDMEKKEMPVLPQDRVLDMERVATILEHFYSGWASRMQPNEDIMDARDDLANHLRNLANEEIAEQVDDFLVGRDGED